MPTPRKTSASSNDDRLAYRVDEFCRLLGMGETTARRHIRAGDIPVVRVGASVFIPRPYVDSLLAS